MSTKNQIDAMDEKQTLIQHVEEGMFDIPEYPRMDYEDIFDEPIAYKQKGLGKFIYFGITKVFGGAFNYTQSTMYYILVMVTGLFLGFAWGVLFGILIFIFNWFVHPMFKIFFLMVQMVGMLLRPSIRIFTDPIFESIGMCYGGIKGQFGVKLDRVTVDLGGTRYENISRIQDL